MITKIAYLLEETLKRDYGRNIEEVALNQQGSAIHIKIRNQFGCATYVLLDDFMVEWLARGILETIQADFIKGRSTDNDEEE